MAELSWSLIFYLFQTKHSRKFLNFCFFFFFFFFRIRDREQDKQSKEMINENTRGQYPSQHLSTPNWTRRKKKKRNNHVRHKLTPKTTHSLTAPLLITQLIITVFLVTIPSTQKTSGLMVHRIRQVRQSQ
ncbi:hypothetical protein ASPSYDRAFT_449620 [Aspergillus sydowii CBS 593.65]|uniref:Uncharacterized protein n=1 Tax=Aspergillus sydowii CBS 593.65 TaxID=1036612 RepID=A0A1L9T6T0_9EURO|nr:uncharacterized protein ASPSYDRAFT_449620 [Aspergillus sydowii CBS 593.65]OJJ55154.1 hypothetical protein ASPSYDRAFT_449620 [Aspergillus sydowii CBS 593.65]